MEMPSTLPTLSIFLVVCLALAASQTLIPPGYEATDDGEYPPCVDFFLYDPCQGLNSTDYRLCDFCELGLYGTCAQGLLYVRPCPVVYYGSIRYRMVFDVKTSSCQMESSSCPRDDTNLPPPFYRY